MMDEAEAWLPGEEAFEILESDTEGAIQGAAARHQFCSIFQYLQRLKDNFGHELLVLIGVQDFILIGLVFGSMLMNAHMYLFMDRHVDAASMTIFTEVAMLPFALKPLLSLLSDSLPLFGFHFKPYVIGTSVLMTIAVAVVGMWGNELPVVWIALLTTIQNLGMAFSMLCVGAQRSRGVKEKPEGGPDLMTFVWMGTTAASLGGSSVAGALIERVGSLGVYRLALCLSWLMIPMASLNYFREVPLDALEVRQAWDRSMSQRGLNLLTLVIALLASFATFIGVLVNVPWIRLSVAVSTVGCLLLICWLVLRPEIAKVITFLVLQSALSIDLSSAMNYFYMDHTDIYPSGPHFSNFFVTSVMGNCSTILAMLGLALYNGVAHNWAYRSILFATSATGLAFSALQIPFVLRWNASVNLSDHACAILLCSTSVAATVRSVPVQVLMAQLCPKGLEGRLFAIFVGMAAAGGGVARLSSAFVLTVLNVQPNGQTGDAAMFERLPSVMLIDLALRFTVLLMVPVMIPDARQADRLLVASQDSATVGSWLHQHGGRDLFRLEPL